jgi:hypothetical protein
MANQLMNTNYVFAQKSSFILFLEVHNRIDIPIGNESCKMFGSFELMAA